MTYYSYLVISLSLARCCVLALLTFLPTLIGFSILGASLAMGHPVELKRVDWLITDTQIIFLTFGVFAILLKQRANAPPFHGGASLQTSGLGVLWLPVGSCICLHLSWLRTMAPNLAVERNAKQAVFFRAIHPIRLNLLANAINNGS